MKEKISRETFDHLVELAALELDEEQAQYLLRELNAQLQSITQLEAIPIPAGTTPSLHGIPQLWAHSAPPREDRWQTDDEASPDDILGQAPQTEGRYIVVPDIPHTSLRGQEEG